MVGYKKFALRVNLTCFAVLLVKVLTLWRDLVCAHGAYAVVL